MEEGRRTFAKAHWNVIFTRPVQDGEVNVVFSFFEIMYSFRVRQGDVDKIWSPSKRSKFEVKSLSSVNQFY